MSNAAALNALFARDDCKERFTAHEIGCKLLTAGTTEYVLYDKTETTANCEETAAALELAVKEITQFPGDTRNVYCYQHFLVMQGTSPSDAALFGDAVCVPIVGFCQ